MIAEQILDSRRQVKAFVYKLCAFSIIGLVLLALANEYLETRIPLFRINDLNMLDHLTSLQYRELVDHQVNANIVIFGSSQSKYGFNPKYLNSKGKTFYNFAMEGSATRFYSHWYKLVFKKHYPKPDAIILEVGDIMFSGALFRPISSHIAYFPLKVFLSALIDPDFPCDYQTMFRNKNKTIFLNSIVQTWLPSEKTENYRANEIYYHGFIARNLTQNLNAPQREDIFPLVQNNIYGQPYTYQYEVVPSYVHRFLELVDQIQQEHIKLIFIFPPGSFVSGAGRLGMNGYRGLRIIRNIAKTRNIPLLDYNDGDKVTAYNYLPRNFTDGNHLSASGSVIFSKRLKRDLEPLLSEAK